MGFIGTPLLQHTAFVLDYARHQLVLLKVSPSGVLEETAIAASDVVLQTRFMLWPGGQPTFAGTLGTMPILIDIDTGDSGTLYATPNLRAQLLKTKRLQADGQTWQLSGLRLGGVTLQATPVHLVEAGGAQDFRTEGHLDQLRLGAALLARYPCVWNFPAKTLTFLKPGAVFLEMIQPGQSH